MLKSKQIAWVFWAWVSVSACGASDDDSGDNGLNAAAGTGGTGGLSGTTGGGSGTSGGEGGQAGTMISAGSGGASGGTGGAGGNAGAGTGGASGMTGGGGGTTGGAGGATGGAGGGDAGAAGMGGGSGEGCTPAPSGMFETMIETGTGPDGNFTIVRPATLGEGGFLHPPVAWGNGLGTTPDLYYTLLENVASNGFVVIANPGTGSNPQVVRDGLEWLIEQNGSGEYAGKLAADCAGTIGYSMGGGAAVGSGAHPAVKAIVSIHGLQDASEQASGPILLTTSDDDGFVTKSMFVQPCYDRSSVQPTILATHITGRPADFTGHIEPLDTGGEDAGPTIAWLRYWIYGDQAQREWFFGPSCKVCTTPWADVQRKNHDWD